VLSKDLLIDVNEVIGPRNKWKQQLIKSRKHKVYDENPCATWHILSLSS
jgi:hypothetical protein